MSQDISSVMYFYCDLVKPQAVGLTSTSIMRCAHSAYPLRFQPLAS